MDEKRLNNGNITYDNFLKNLDCFVFTKLSFFIKEITFFLNIFLQRSSKTLFHHDVAKILFLYNIISEDDNHLISIIQVSLQISSDGHLSILPDSIITEAAISYFIFDCWIVQIRWLQEIVKNSFGTFLSTRPIFIN